MKTRMCLTGFLPWQRREECLGFVHTFSPWKTHVQMKALTPSLMKPADERAEDPFREALMEGRPRNPQISQPMKGGETKQTKTETQAQAT